ncbi:uncharacterized protein [Amphiura filiformis]|uniref:uncharacterized protein n=1 Tax=Amphiura filiformis TaxID=82378 RepID=UPI003B22874A
MDMMETDLSRSLTALGITPYQGSAFDLRVDLNYRNMQRLPNDLFKLVELQWLNLNVNKLRDLPQGMSALKKLKWLYLENNCFDKFPRVLCELKDLMKLYFSNNTVRNLPIQVRQLTHLRLLDLSDNNLSEFPMELCTDSLCNLEKLFLDNHNFTSLPAQISALKGLKLLWLNDNKLEWLPQSLCELVELEELQVKNSCLMYLPAYLTSRLSKLQTFEWKGCPLIAGVQEALEDGLDGLREYQRKLNEEIEQENKVQFRSEKGGSWDRPCYRMRTRPRGVAIIIDNFCSMEWPTGDSSRNASRATPTTSGRHSGASDAGSDDIGSTEEGDSTDKLRNTLIKLGFNVRVMRGLMSLDIISALRFLSLEDHSYFDSLVVCILSHGTETTIVGPDGIAVDIKQLTDIFSSENCPMLAHKPKLFFLQMLENKNSKHTEKSSPRRSPTFDSETPPPPPPPQILLPDDPDFLLTFALVPKSAISESKQSVYHFYVGVLFGMLERFARKLNLLDVMTTVHSEIKRIRLSTDKASSVHITPRLQSTLKYNVYLSVHSSSAVHAK